MANDFPMWQCSGLTFACSSADYCIVWRTGAGHISPHTWMSISEGSCMASRVAGELKKNKCWRKLTWQVYFIQITKLLFLPLNVYCPIKIVVFSSIAWLDNALSGRSVVLCQQFVALEQMRPYRGPLLAELFFLYIHRADTKMCEEWIAFCAGSC